MPVPRRILIADGNYAHTKGLKDYLSDADYDIHVAIDGPDALYCVARFNPQLILLDPIIPGINGFDICKQIKDDPSTRRTMVLIVTGMNELADIERAVEAGTDDFLSKPVNKTELLKRVENLLKLHDIMGYQL